MVSFLLSFFHALSYLLLVTHPSLLTYPSSSMFPSWFLSTFQPTIKRICTPRRWNPILWLILKMLLTESLVQRSLLLWSSACCWLLGAARSVSGSSYFAFSEYFLPIYFFTSQLHNFVAPPYLYLGILLKLSNLTPVQPQPSKVPNDSLRYVRLHLGRSLHHRTPLLLHLLPTFRAVLGFASHQHAMCDLPQLLNCSNGLQHQF